MIYDMNLAAEYFDKTRSGKKTIECRLYDEKRKKLVVGDRIKFSDAQNQRRSIVCEVIALHRFSMFKELLEHFPNTSFGGSNETEALSALKKFYSTEDEKKYGVVGIEIKLIKENGGQV